MSRKPPANVYGHNVTLQTCTGVDRWQEPTWSTQAISGVNVQPANGIALTKDNAQVQYTAMLFADSLYTSPALDWWDLKNTSEAAGHPLTVVFEGNTFTVVQVDKIFNEFCAFDHWEVLLK